MTTAREQIENLRLRGETGKAKRAFLDYSALGPQRSIPMLLEQYRDPDRYVQTNYRDKKAPPTRQLNTLKQWSSAYDWVVRAGTITDKQTGIILREQEKGFAEAMQYTYAQVANRVKVLNSLTELLVAHIQDQGIIRTIVKVSRGKFAEETQVDVLAITALRGLLDDLAKETGGRVRALELSGADGGPIELSVTARNTLEGRLLQGAALEDQKEAA